MLILYIKKNYAIIYVLQNTFLSFKSLIWVKICELDGVTYMSSY